MSLERIEDTEGLDYYDLTAHIVECYAEIDRLEKGIKAVESLINDSDGVSGLHLNGDIAPWESIRTGGRLEEWLVDFDSAL